MAQKKIIVITAPSGSGKTTLVKRLLQSCPELSFSISACTRNPRPGEQHGKDYYFYSEAAFTDLIAQDAFIEYEMVYTGKYYGTLKSELNRIWDEGKFPLVDIDVKGALAINEHLPNDTLTIFIEAPSIEELRNRLIKRGTETPQTLEERIDKAKYELTFASQFHKIVVNEHLDTATEELHQIVLDFLK